jgi:hypothetical protein
VLELADSAGWQPIHFALIFPSPDSDLDYSVMDRALIPFPSVLRCYLHRGATDSVAVGISSAEGRRG